MINCLKISEILNDKVVIITAGEDEFIKIWDTKFNLINEFNLRKTGFFEGTATTRVNLFHSLNFLRIFQHSPLTYFLAKSPNDMERPMMNSTKTRQIKACLLC